jgi:hypothetical protein
MIFFVNSSYRTYILVSILLFSAFSLISSFSSILLSYAHIEHLTHYNQGGDGVGKFYAYEIIEPEYAHPGKPARIVFTAQDENGKDVYNIDTMVEIYDAITGKRLEVYPWTRQAIGDFEVPYLFQTLEIIR